MPHFNKSDTIPIVDLGNGIQRQMLGYDSNLTLVRVYFEKGAVGEAHTHPHQQATYIEEGRFEVEIERVKKMLSAGDSFSVSGDMEHSVVALEQGILIDAFSPAREDFLAH
ncbi:cupin domain-containing protein [Candidatus Neomarinimicrobiota bacterium]